jgi:DNA-binding NarL/FixJ family response regulator
MTMQPPLRILLADDHEAARRGLRSILQPQWEVCAEASDGQEAIDQARAVRPDVVLLDLRMPRVNGLQAARQILREHPGVPVLLLTVQPSDELAAEAKRAGIEAVIAKSDADTLSEFLERIAQQTVHLAGTAVRHRRHIGAFFASDDEKYRVLAPFVAEGLSRGERAFHMVNGAGSEVHADRLAQAGVDLHDDGWQGSAEVVAWDEMYLAGGRFDQHAMLERIQRVLRGPAGDGAQATRLVANMEWALEPRPGVDDLAEYESRLNYIDPLFPDVIVCAYNIGHFNARVIVDVMRAHPAMVVGGSLFENPFYVQPDQLIGEIHTRRVT